MRDKRRHRAQLFRQRECDVLGIHARRQSAGERDANRLRNAQPDLAGDENGREIRRPDAGGECVQRAVHHRVAIRADGEAAGMRASGFHHQLMADAFADIPQQDAVPRGERRMP